jgi:hypothetical protein
MGKRDRGTDGTNPIDRRLARVAAAAAAADGGKGVVGSLGTEPFLVDEAASAGLVK